MLCSLDFFLLLSWHHHQAEDFYFSFQGEEAGLGPGVGV